MLKIAVSVVLISLLLHYFFNIFPLSVPFHKLVPYLPYLGMTLCFTLAALGTTRGLSTISSAVSGGSILTPRIGAKSMIGTVFCEANFLYAIITDIMLYAQFPKPDDPFLLEKGSIIFACGFVVGICCYFSSVSTGIVCGAISVMDAKDQTLFPKLVAMELISSSIGLMGLVIGFVMREKIGGLQ